VRLARAKSALLPHVHVVVGRENLRRGFQHAKDRYVPITEEELESLEAKLKGAFNLKEVHSACLCGSGLL
jgi:non-homologous end joining protein Ku